MSDKHLQEVMLRTKKEFETKAGIIFNIYTENPRFISAAKHAIAIGYLESSPIDDGIFITAITELGWRYLDGITE